MTSIGNASLVTKPLIVLQRMPSFRPISPISGRSSACPIALSGIQSRLLVDTRFVDCSEVMLSRPACGKRTRTGISSIPSRIEPPTAPSKFACSCIETSVSDRPAKRAAFSSVLIQSFGLPRGMRDLRVQHAGMLLQDQPNLFANFLQAADTRTVNAVLNRRDDGRTLPKLRDHDLSLWELLVEIALQLTNQTFDCVFGFRGDDRLGIICCTVLDHHQVVKDRRRTAADQPIDLVNFRPLADRRFDRSGDAPGVAHRRLRRQPDLGLKHVAIDARKELAAKLRDHDETDAGGCDRQQHRHHWMLQGQS